MLIKGELGVGGREAGRLEYGNPLYFLLSFVVKLNKSANK